MSATVERDARMPSWLYDYTPEEWRWMAREAVALPEEARPRGDMHERGAPCLVMGLLLSHYGHDGGMHMLYEYTCFPFSDWHALPQALALVDDRGR